MMAAAFKKTKGFLVVKDALAAKGYQPFPYQTQTWQAIHQQKSGLVNAPTGYGKTYAVFLGVVIQFINQHPTNYQHLKDNGLQLLWITPLRALAKDIARAMTEALLELNIPWQVGIRNGDTNQAERQLQKRKMPEILIITPESLHLLLAQKNHDLFFKHLKLIAVDEWHELLGSKRGVQVELALSRLKKLTSKTISIWGISATIGNLEEAKDVLLFQQSNSIIIKAQLKKITQVISILPNEIEKYPWAGHLGIKLIDKIIPLIHQHQTTLIFINTRGMSEMWYQAILNASPDLAGAIALHHGSIEQELRLWVEEALHTQKLKAVICTASLDLGVDFRPVDAVIQVGSPKGVARFLQRAGRSRHHPGAKSTIYFLPTNSLELIEAVALKKAIEENITESKEPLLLCYDVLIQYLCTLAIGNGFNAALIFEEIKNTFCFQSITENDWLDVIQQITHGGNALRQYDEYQKVILDNHLHKITNKRMAMQHRMHIGTIVSDAMMKVKLLNGKFIGVIEEWFISKLEPGDVFTLAGRNLELLQLKEMTVLVKPSKSKKSIVPSWMGGRMPLSANLGAMLRTTIHQAKQFILSKNINQQQKEFIALQPLLLLQNQLSHLPSNDELLIEYIANKEGYHLFIYPFEGRLVHEAMAALLAYRIGEQQPISFSLAMNDYGFELLSDQPFQIASKDFYTLLSTKNLISDIQKSVNAVEMAKRKFRDIAVIGGLLFLGYPGAQKKARHLQSSSSLLFQVFSEYDPDNILIRQAYQEVFQLQMEEARLRATLQRIQNSKIVYKQPEQYTPLSFPIAVDGLNRENLSSEKLEDRIKRMQAQLSENLHK